MDKYHFFFTNILSQWATTKFTDENNITYTSCEQYMMYQKEALSTYKNKVTTVYEYTTTTETGLKKTKTTYYQKVGIVGPR